MNNSSFKYPIPQEAGHSEYEINMHAGARLLSVHNARGEGVIYAMVDAGAPLIPRRVVNVQSGRFGPDDIAQLEYLGTYTKLDGQIAFHVFIAPESWGT